MAIVLIRHAETACNAARVVQVPEASLSERGIAQAERLARRLAAQGITNILSSDLRRAVMTAERIQTATGAPIDLDVGLQERNFGDDRGRAYADLGIDIFAPDYSPRGGEGWEVFHARVDSVWSRVRRAAGRAAGSLAVVTHGLVCYSLAFRHLCLPAGGPVPLRWANTSVTVIDAHPPWRVHALNCVAHLDDQTGEDPLALSGG